MILGTAPNWRFLNPLILSINPSIARWRSNCANNCDRTSTISNIYDCVVFAKNNAGSIEHTIGTTPFLFVVQIWNYSHVDSKSDIFCPGTKFETSKLASSKQHFSYRSSLCLWNQSSNQLWISRICTGANARGHGGRRARNIQLLLHVLLGMKNKMLSKFSYFNRNSTLQSRESCFFVYFKALR